MGKSSDVAGGYRFKLRNHSGLIYGEIDAYVEFRAGDKTAWKGLQTTSGTITVNAPNLLGGDKDQGGIVGSLYVMMGEATQTPNAMLQSAFGNQTAAWRGFATVAFDGIYGSNNPYPQPAAHKVEKILKGWDSGAAWYPEKARIPLATIGAPAPIAGYFQVEAGDHYTLSDETVNYGTVSEAYIATADEIAANAIAARNATTGSSYVSAGSQLTYLSGHPAIVGWEAGHGPYVGIAAIRVTPVCPDGYNVSFAEGDPETPTVGIDSPVVMCSLSNYSVNSINAAHALYYLRTQSHLGGEPTANIDDASWRAAADQLYGEGFGICVRIDPDKESVEDVENRICKLIGGSVTRSLEDGKLYLDLARGNYTLEDLPIITDDDILDFSEQPTTPEGAINSVSVRYFNQERKETVITPSADALGLIDEFGLNHQVVDYPEIPVAALATRIATRELMNYVTPSRVFDLVLKPTAYALRPNQYFRLQAPKRGIADMACIVGDKQGGTLKSGAIRLQAAQDIYTLPDFGTVQVEPGVDPTPDPVPVAIVSQRAFEAPYLNVCAALSSTELAALADDAGYLIGIAEDPASSRDFAIAVDVGGGFAIHAEGDWCPTAVVNEAALIVDPLPTSFTLSAGKRLEEVIVGDVALWGDELCRVDALNAGAGTVTLGRGCGDTVPLPHSAGEKVWFYGEGAAGDPTEYSDGETVSVKLLTNSWSQQLDVASATALSVTFDRRQARPYPPGKLRIGTSAAPTAVSGAFSVSWTHRNRVQQADQLIDTEAASVGPEDGVRYGLAFYRVDTDALLISREDLGGDSATVTLAYTGDVRMELWAISANGESWQRHERVFAYSGGGSVSDIDGDLYDPYGGGTVVDGGDVGGGSSTPPPAPIPPSGGAGNPGTTTPRTIGADTEDACAHGASPSASASTNSTAVNAAFAALAAGGGEVYFSVPGTYQINTANPVKPINNSRLNLAGVKLQAADTTTVTSPSVGRHVVRIESVSEVEVVGDHISGYLAYWNATGGKAVYGVSEWAHGISIANGAFNVTVKGLTIDNCVGDAVSIGYTCHHIEVDNNRMTNCRRQGISNGGDNYRFTNNKISYISGTAPQSGMDLEADNSNGAEHGVVSGNTITNCAGPGIIGYLRSDDTSIDDNTIENCSIGISLVGSTNGTITNNRIRFNRSWGVSFDNNLSSGLTCATWSMSGNSFWSNRTSTYPKVATVGSGTSVSGQNTLTKKHVYVDPTCTGISLGANTYGP
jgi:parallel beta-helix repeat protein